MNVCTASVLHGGRKDKTRSELQIITQFFQVASNYSLEKAYIL